MKYQIPFTGKNKKNIINLSSAENAQRVVKVKTLFMQSKAKTMLAKQLCCTQTKMYRLHIIIYDHFSI